MVHEFNSLFFECWIFLLVLNFFRKDIWFVFHKIIYFFFLLEFFFSFFFYFPPSIASHPIMAVRIHWQRTKPFIPSAELDFIIRTPSPTLEQHTLQPAISLRTRPQQFSSSTSSRSFLTSSNFYSGSLSHPEAVLIVQSLLYARPL